MIKTNIYKVVSTKTEFCNNNMDTFIVNVMPSTPSAIRIIASDTNIKAGKKVYVSTIGVNCLNPIYEWQINGVAIPGEVGKTLVYKEFKDLDTLICRLICNDTCASPKDTISNQIILHVTPKSNYMEEINNQTTDFRLYPNPNTGNFTLTAININGLVVLDIIDMIGQNLYSEQFMVQAGFNSQINVGSFPNGIYLLNISTAKGNQTLRFMIQH